MLLTYLFDDEDGIEFIYCQYWSTARLQRKFSANFACPVFFFNVISNSFFLLLLEQLETPAKPILVSKKKIS